MNTKEIDLFGSICHYELRNIIRELPSSNKIREGVLGKEYPYRVYKLAPQSNIKLIDTFRVNTVSSSEIAKILNVSRYSNAKEVLLKKLGYIKPEDTIYTIIGKETESVAAKLYTYYPKGESKQNDEIFLHNYRNNLVVNNIEKESHVFIIEIVLNFTDSIFILVSPDYYDTDLLAPVEIKTINEFSFSKFDKDKISYDYIFQSLLQQIVYGSDIGYLFYVVSNYNIVKKTIKLRDYIDDFVISLPVIIEFIKILNHCRDRKLSFKDVVSSFYIDENFDVGEVSEYKKWIDSLKAKDKSETSMEITENEEINKLNDMLQNYNELNTKKNELEKECKKIKNIIKQAYIDKLYIKTDIVEVSLNPFRIKIREK